MARNHFDHAVTEALVNDAGQPAGDVALRGYDAAHLAVALFVGATVFTSTDLTLCEAAAGCTSPTKHHPTKQARPTLPNAASGAAEAQRFRLAE